MEITELKAFVTVAKSGSFSLAAETLYLTQPAVSKRVASLEEKLGARLFDRLGRRVSLTEAGRELLPRAQHILLEISDISRSISSLGDEIGGTLTMGTSHHIGLHRLPSVLRAFSYSHPQVRLDIRFMDSESACAAVERGDLELAIVTLPPGPSNSLKLEEVWHDPLHFVAAEDHPLAAMPTVRLPDLAAYPAVLAARGTYTREILETALAPLHIQLQIGMATNYLETLKMMTTIGLGWSLLPQTMVRDGQLKSLKLQTPRLARSLGIVSHPNRTLSNAARTMRETCLASVGIDVTRAR
ncbi:MAG: LysR family transcriptional regulator [Gammaproteobacteria bacterium]|nr:LysR family transcriptional regulator [Gammaproteobacteria bacterium]